MEKVINYANKETIYKTLIESLGNRLTTHPFDLIENEEELKNTLPHFLAISLAFPYILSGSCAAHIRHCIDEGCDISEELEITGVVGSFLSWDEWGGSYVIEKYGKRNLLKILDTEKFVHANLLRQDLKKLTGEAVSPDFSGASKTYLTLLIAGLENKNLVIRCAYMVAFELHAELVISSLWSAIKRVLKEPSVTLHYFECHVGEKDPAEEVHIEVTSKVIEKLVSCAQKQEFISYVDKAFNESIQWGKSIIHTNV